MKLKIITYINAHKITIPPLILMLMALFRNWSLEAVIYLALHGTYCLLWLMKQALFPDRRFEERVPLGIGFTFIFLPLGTYAIAPYLLISRHVTLAPWAIGVALFLFTLGSFLHYVADAQKYYTLQLRRGLLEDGLFARTRNPNYLGEVLIYAAFALLSWHWLPFVVLAGWCGFFFRNMDHQGPLVGALPGVRGLPGPHRPAAATPVARRGCPGHGRTTAGAGAIPSSLELGAERPPKEIRREGACSLPAWGL
ncbi:MAG: DUF1295 domain-containing protein [Verrucomicrobiota bacterium]